MGLAKGLEAVKEELDTHLDSINANTSEIQACFDYLAELENKINKITERLDEVQLVVNPDVAVKEFNVELSLREQEVFMCLYVQDKPITLKDIARKIGLTEAMVNNILYKLIHKGIPVTKNYLDETMFYNLENSFKDMQARKNLLNIDEKISKEMLAQKLI